MNAGAVVIVSAFALIVRSLMLGSFAQKGYCWRIPSESASYRKVR